MALDPELTALFDRMVVAKKPSSKEKEKKKPKKEYQNGNGYEYIKVWDEQGIGYRMVPRARVEMAKLLGRELESSERVFFIDRTLKGDIKYGKENMLLGTEAGIDLSKLTCKNCNCKGEWKSNL